MLLFWRCWPIISWAIERARGLMPLYRYAARQLTGEKISGEAPAASVPALSADLSADGLVLVEARAVKDSWLAFDNASRPAKLSALMTFIRELRALVSAGIPVATALTKLEGRRDDAALAAAIISVRTQVERGTALETAMSEHPHVFDALTRATVRAGTASGSLESALERLLTFLTIRHQLQRKIRQAMIYPIFLLGLLAIVLVVLMLFVLPGFADLYADFGSDLPMPTQVLMNAVRVAPIAIPVIGLAGFGLLALVRLWLRVPEARLIFDRQRLNIPVVGPVSRNFGLVQVSFMMSMLLTAGATLRDALSMTAESLSNADQRRRLTEVAHAITAGQSLKEGLLAVDIYPDLSLSLLAAGEQAGDLDRMFAEVAKLHEDALDERLSRVIALIEPVMMLIVGAVLGAVIISVYLPIFGISGVVE